MMKDASAFIAMTLAFPGALFGLIEVSLSNWKQAFFLLGASVALFISASVALRGGSLWFLRAALTGTFIAFFFSGAPMGLMEGGIFTIPIFFLLLMGAITSLCARREEL